MPGFIEKEASNALPFGAIPDEEIRRRIRELIEKESFEYRAWDGTCVSFDHDMALQPSS